MLDFQNTGNLSPDAPYRCYRRHLNTLLLVKEAGVCFIWWKPGG